MRKIKFANDEYYHIYNRGVDKRDIFMEEKDIKRLLIFLSESLVEKNKEVRPLSRRSNLFLGNLVELICYCLNPNHYHLILKQLEDNGVSKFMKSFGTSYTMFFNQKYNRSGSLFQGKFKAVHIETNEYILWLSGYINGNAEIHKIAKADNYLWSSYQDYLGLRNGTLCNKEIILSQFKNINEYKEYVEMVIKESGRRKDGMKEYVLEET